jgi:hypothetical protein
MPHTHFAVSEETGETITVTQPHLIAALDVLMDEKYILTEEHRRLKPLVPCHCGQSCTAPIRKALKDFTRIENLRALKLFDIRDRLEAINTEVWKIFETSRDATANEDPK